VLVSILAVGAGLVLLAYAADQFVLGAARVALLLRIAPVVVGVVVVGFGTSAPELLVSALAAAGGQAEVAVGNVVGSNLANLTLLLGIGALLLPLAVASGVVRREAPLAVAAMVVFGVLVQGGFTRIEGLLLLAAMAAVVGLVLRGSRQGADPLGPETVELADEPRRRATTEGLRTLLGLAGTVAGAQLLLWGALDLAERAGLGPGFVGATLVAVGTSLPELVTVIQSARRREADLIVGNLLGSNLFNSLGVAGVAALVGPATLDAPNLTFVAAGAAVVAGVAAWAMMHTGRLVSRREGALLVAAYVVVLPLLT
jgi:cation:H+ antiporter